MGQQQKFRRDQTQGDLIASIPGLWVVAVNFTDGVFGCVQSEQFAAADYGPAGMEQSALIGTPGGIADHDRQHIDTEAVVFGVSGGEVQE